MVNEDNAQLVSEIMVPDLDPPIAFLQSLGFTIDRRSGNFAALRWNDSLLFLAVSADATIERRFVNVRVMVADVDATWRKVKDLGLKILNPIGDRYYGLRDFVVGGPDAIEIRFAQVR